MKLTLLFGFLALVAACAFAEDSSTCIEATFKEEAAVWNDADEIAEQNDIVFAQAKDAVNQKNKEIANSIPDADVVNFEEIAERLGQEVSDKFAKIKQFKN